MATETTTKEMTINGVVVAVSQPYAAGHVVTEAEAKALNQVRGENIGNNLRKQIKEKLPEDGEVTEELQAEIQDMVTAYDEGYEFTLASIGGGSTARLDPLTKEARAVAKAALTNRLREAGLTQKAYVEEHGKEAFDAKVVEISEMEQVIAVAKQNLAEREKLGALKI